MQCERKKAAHQRAEVRMKNEQDQNKSFGLKRICANGKKQWNKVQAGGRGGVSYTRNGWQQCKRTRGNDKC